MNHQAEIETALCLRDYELMERYHPGLLSKIEAAIAEGVTPQQIRRWSAKVVTEEEIIQRVFNAARWIKGVQ